MVWTGHWKFNWPRAVILIAPSLYILTGIYCFYYGRFIFGPIYNLYRTNPTTMKIGVNIESVLRLLVGYWFITSFYKSGEASAKGKNNR